MRLLGTFFLVAYTFPANVFAMIPFVIVLALVFRSYIRISRLFRRHSSATMGSLNSVVMENVNGAQTIRTFNSQEFSIDQCMREIDNQQVHVGIGWCQFSI
jgi:ABC-type multidrug transport system fused ATPase/permease subunit